MKNHTAISGSMVRKVCRVVLTQVVSRVSVGVGRSSGVRRRVGDRGVGRVAQSWVGSRGGVDYLGVRFGAGESHGRESEEGEL